MPAPAREQEAAFEAGGFQAVFRVPGRVSMMAQQGAGSFRLATATIAPELIVRAAPALDTTAFLEAGFKNAEENAAAARPRRHLSRRPLCRSLVGGVDAEG